MRMGVIVSVFMVLDLALILTLSMVCISDDCNAPGCDGSIYDNWDYEILEIHDDYMIYRQNGHCFMEYPDGKIRIISRTEMHVTFVPSY